MRKFTFALFMFLSIAIVFVGCSNDTEDDADSFPQKTIEIVVPYGPGGGTDIIARIIAEGLEEQLDESVIVTNIEGAGGIIGGEEVLDAEPNGYKLLIDDDPTMTLTDLNGDRNYGVFDFEPIAQFTVSPELLGMSSKNDWENLDDVVAAAQENPGQIKFGATAGTFSELLPIVIQDEKDIEVNIVMFDGSADRNTALLSGEADLGMISLSEAEQYLESGDITLISTLSGERITELPDVLTLSEQGVDFEHASARGLFAPKETPEEIIKKISDALGELAADEEFTERIATAGSTVEYIGYKEYTDSLDKAYKSIEEILNID